MTLQAKLKSAQQDPNPRQILSHMPLPDAQVAQHAAWRTTLTRDFYNVLNAYEELLTQKHGRTTKAARTRQKLARVGV